MKARLEMALALLVVIVAAGMILTTPGCCPDCGGPAYLTRAYDLPEQPIVLKYRHYSDWGKWSVSEKDIEQDRRIRALEAEHDAR